MINSNRGFVIILALAILPVLMTLTFLSAQLFHVLLVYRSTHARCRTEVIQSQERLAELLTALLRLNPDAARLRTMEFDAQRQVARAVASGNPPAIAAAQAALLVVHSQQSALVLQQQTLLSEARRRLARSYVDLRNQPELRQADLTPTTQPLPFGLAVEPQPMDSRSPDYVPVAQFEQAQALAYSWRAPLQRFMPESLQNRISFFNHLSGQCSATIRKEKTQWIASFNRVRS